MNFVIVNTMKWNVNIPVLHKIQIIGHLYHEMKKKSDRYDTSVIVSENVA